MTHSEDTDFPKLQEPLISAETDATQSNTPQISLFKDQIILNPTISKLNFFAFLLFSTYLGAIIIPANLLFQPLLTVVYGLDTDDRINVTTIVQLSQLAIKLIITPWLGFFCDKYGRKLFVILGVIFLSGSVALVPNLPNVYPYYILVQLCFELGMMFLMTAPLLADYIDYETKGRVAGLASVISYAASSVTTWVVSTIDLKSNIPSKLHEIGILALAIGFITVLGLKGGAYHKKLYYDKKAEEAKKHVPEMIEQEEKLLEEEEKEQAKKSFGAKSETGRSKVKVRPEAQQDQESLLENSDKRILIDVNGLNLNDSVNSRKDTHNHEVGKSMAAAAYKPGFMAGIREAKRSPWILTGYICGFLCYANVMLVNTVLVNYCTSVIGSEEGANQAYSLTNKHMIVSCITSAVFGVIADKYNKFKILLFIVITSVVSVFLLIFSPTPYNAMAYISMVLFGVTCAGYMTLTNQLVTKYADPKYRASVFAVSSMFTVLGSTMTNILGVFLSKYYVTIPFYIYLGCAGAGLILLGAIYSRKKAILDKL